ncbi:DNA-binding protein [Streptomyces sp. ME01-24h]|nr:DNA-binding protein [Streptomyces sp. ME01-24h]
MAALDSLTACWSRRAIEALGPTTDVPTTAAIIGVDSDTVYGMIRRGEWTMTRVLRLGRRIKLPTRDLIAYLYEPETAARSPESFVPVDVMPLPRPALTSV